MQLESFQMYLVGIIAVVIVYLLNWLSKRYNWSPQRGWLTAGVYVISGLLALVWGSFVLPAFPPFTDAVGFISALLWYINALLVALGPVVAFATLIYNALLKQVLDKLANKLSQ